MSEAPPEPAYDAFTADELFKEYFWRWYKPLEREVRGEKPWATTLSRWRAVASRASQPTCVAACCASWLV